MSALFRALRGRKAERQWPTLGLDDWGSYFNFGGLTYPLSPQTTLAQQVEEPPSDFGGYVSQLYKSNGVVFACMGARQRLFSEASFQFQRIRTGELFGSPALAPLEQPWGPSSTTGDLLMRMIQDVDLAGNAFIARLPDGSLSHCRPDWVTIVSGSRMSADSNPNWQLDSRIVGFLYYPGGKSGGMEPEVVMPWNMAHFIDTPDPTARWRGMSWLTPIVREVMADSAAMTHKLMFFQQGATPNLVVEMGENVTPENFQKFTQLFEEQQEGVLNAYKTLFFGGGAKVEVVGAQLQQMDFKVTQGHGETRIAAAAGVPPIVANLSEGLENATYSNFSQARRAFGDGTIRPLWRKLCGSMQSLVDMASVNASGSPARLWYDARHIPFLREDTKDEAQVVSTQASAINTLITAGFEPDAAITAVVGTDLGQLKGGHSGLVSVQLLPPGSQGSNGSSANGNGAVPADSSAP